MTTSLLISFCVLLLLAYVFDLSSKKTRVPSVILLLLLGWLTRQICNALNITVPDLQPLLPLAGTVGLILIVLEGSLELELDGSKKRLVRQSAVVALIPMLLLAFALAWLFQYYGGAGNFSDSLLNAVPLCVISSAIAIPTVKNLQKHHREFIIYESSLSDILGVLFFNFIALNSSFGWHSIGHFLLEILIILLISFIATAVLSLLLSRIDHHVKFVPIIVLIILIYAVAKIFHLPGLIVILCLGLFLGNLDALKQYKWIRYLKPELLDAEVHKFREITTEGAFLIRSMFFLLFGFLMKTEEIIETDTLAWAAGIVMFALALRFIQLRISGLPVKPLLFIAPRGLITILLFLSIAPERTIPLVNRSLVVQVIILSALVMMMGMMASSRKSKPNPEND
jgi:cell volume regulation protein A